MFYSHQLLARKAPLGQIWMAATLHRKINRRSLDKLDIIQICEEILNPSVPMALRLSGILMGGVVIIYERKVKLLYDDVTRLVIEINEAWRVKSVADPTVLPKGKTQAKYEAVTLPDHVDMEIEQALHHSDASLTTARLQRMRLEDLDEIYININPGEDGVSQHFHQADAANITLVDDFRSLLAETDLTHHFERFDIDGDEETQINFTPLEQPQAAFNIIPSPPQQDEHTKSPANPQPSQPINEAPLPDDVDMAQPMEVHEEQTAKEPSNEAHEVEVDVVKQKAMKRKACRNLAHVIMDNDQTMIAGSVYHTWIQDASNIVSKRGRNSKPRSPVLSTKISELMDMPPLALISGLETNPAELHYPAPLLELWRKSAKPRPAKVSPSSDEGEISLPQAPENPATHSPPKGLYATHVPEFAGPDDFQSEVGSHRADSIEKMRAQLESMGFPAVNEALLSDVGVTPGSSGKRASSGASSGSGNTFDLMRQEMRPPSVRSKRQQSSGRGSVESLDPVEEEITLETNRKGPKLTKLSEDGPSTDQELLLETGPTQTPIRKARDPSFDQITHSIRTHLKLHFESPGAPEFESLDQLAYGMNHKKAAQLFYQTCVLATHDFIKVKQMQAYGEILISRGPEM